MTSLLDLPYDEAKTFLLKGESYCRIDLPAYITFDELISSVEEEVRGETIESITAVEHEDGNTRRLRPNEFEGINHFLLDSKDGKYAWRPLQLINPVIYCMMVNYITNEDEWGYILERFNTFRDNPKIECVSIPVRSRGPESDKADSVSQWWHNVEQNSIKNAIDHEYMMNTDITD